MKIPEGVELDTPVFVLGSPRSGTTLLRLMLTCHPALVIPPECGFQAWLSPRWPADRPFEVEAFVADVVGARKFETWEVSAATLLPFLRDRAPRTYADACAWVVVCYGLVHGASFRRWGDKTNYHLHHVPTLASLWPRATFVHIVRDGRDVAASYLELSGKEGSSPYHPRLPTSIEAIAERWAGDLEAVRAGLAAVPATRSVEVRYEDLVRSPEAELRRLCKTIGEEYSDRMLDYPRRNRDESLEPSAFLEWKARTLEPPSTGTIGRWRRDLTAEQAERFARIADRALARYGYEAA